MIHGARVTLVAVRTFHTVRFSRKTQIPTSLLTHASMKTMSRCWLIALVVLAVGCYVGHSVSMPGPEFNFQTFIDGIASFPYDAPASKQEKVVEAFPQLKVGMDKDSVNTLLGDPDAEFLTYADDNEQDFQGSSWGYYLHRHEAELVDEKHDITVFVYFDANGKLERANLDEPHSVTETYDPAQRYPAVSGDRIRLNIISTILLYSLGLIACALALAGATTRYRGDRHWSTLFEVIGLSIMLASLVLMLVQPYFFTWTGSGLLGWRVVLNLAGIGFALFCTGYMVTARRFAANIVAKNTEP
ncbi:MAG: hypothetical protein IT365_05585 [Candidatus Hydrogenedentes bacterium]|nr:hypothetical protein [Candidatus Hydrogenedentota bacterium]